MIFKGRFRTVRHQDHAVPAPLPRPLLGPEAYLDIRAWRRAGGIQADSSLLLLVTSPRKTGIAVRRNRFRRQVRMAFLALSGRLAGHSWIVWVRPARNAPPLDRITFGDIEAQLGRALHRLSPTDTP